LDQPGYVGAHCLQEIQHEKGWGIELLIVIAVIPILAQLRLACISGCPGMRHNPILQPE